MSFRSFELEPGVVVSGKIDRVDGDRMGARGIVIDYKSGAAAVRGGDPASATFCSCRSTCSCCAISSGWSRWEVSTSPSAAAAARAASCASRTTGSPGSAARDYLEPDEFDADVDTARATAVGLAERIRAGDVKHDPHGGECPHWCDLWRICRKERP